MVEELVHFLLYYQNGCSHVVEGEGDPCDQWGDPLMEVEAHGGKEEVGDPSLRLLPAAGWPPG